MRIIIPLLDTKLYLIIDKTSPAINYSLSYFLVHRMVISLPRNKIYLTRDKTNPIINRLRSYRSYLLVHHASDVEENMADGGAGAAGRDRATLRGVAC